MEHDASKLVADFVKNHAEAKAFLEDADKYLSRRGFELSKEDKTALKSIVENLLNKKPSKWTYGHTDFAVHTSYTSGDIPSLDHTDRLSHTNYTSAI